jgi:uncharacterized membrane protein YkvA (DUF1232 family)
MRIELDLRPDDPGVAPLRTAWQRAAARHAGRHNALAHIARERFAELQQNALPPLVREPLSLIPELAELLDATHWTLPDTARDEFAGALAYFVDRDDLIPDDAERVGLLDDALVIKLALASVEHEWLAWRDYRAYLSAHPDDAGIDRETWLQRRQERFARDLRRRNAENRYPASGRRDVAFGDAGRYAESNPTTAKFGVR